MAVKPRLSVLLPAMLGYRRTLAALQAWQSQRSVSETEILLLLPSRFLLAPDEQAGLHEVCRVIPVGESQLHEARAIGVQLSHGDYVVMAEDHCLPDAGWVEAVLKRLEHGWDGIGGVLRPGNREDCWSESAFLLGYGQWARPQTGGPIGVLCGHNCTVRRELFEQFGDGLADELLICAFLTRKLQAQGCRFYLDRDATMRHYDPSTVGTNIRLFFIVGLGFGALRSVNWGWCARMLYALLLPVVAGLHYRRAVRHFIRMGRGRGIRGMALPASLVLSCFWAAGEAVGVIIGRSRVAGHMWQTEVKPVSQEMVERSDAA